MSRLSEDALKRGLEAANVRIASLEKQLAFYKASYRAGAREEASRFDVVKKIEKKAKKD